VRAVLPQSLFTSHAQRNMSQAVWKALAIAEEEGEEEEEFDDFALSSFRERMDNVKKIDGVLNNSPCLSDEVELLDMKLSGKAQELSRQMTSEEREEFENLVEKDLLGFDAERNALMTRIVSLRIEDTRSGMTLLPSHYVGQNAELIKWPESGTISFLIPVAVEDEEQLKDFVHEALEKWLLLDMDIFGSHLDAFVYENIIEKEDEGAKKDLGNEQSSKSFRRCSTLRRFSENYRFSNHSNFELVIAESDEALEEKPHRSRFGIVDEVVATYSYSVKIPSAGMLFLESVANIRSDVENVLESPTIANFGKPWVVVGEGEKQKMIISWESRELNEARASRHKSKKESCFSTQSSQETVGILRRESRAIQPNSFLLPSSSFDFKSMIMKEMQHTSVNNYMKALPKILRFKCRFEPHQIDRALKIAGNADSFLVALDGLNRYLEEIRISASDAEGNSMELAEADREIIAALFPNCCKISVRVLAGGFSGSMVLQSLSVDATGAFEDSAVLKLDTPENVIEEESRHRMMIKHLGDHAPLILGRVAYSQRAGIKISLAGGQSLMRTSAETSSNKRLITLKELYLYEQKGLNRKHEVLPRKTLQMEKVKRREEAILFLTENLEESKPEVHSTGVIHSVHNILLELFGEVFEKCTVSSSFLEIDTKKNGSVLSSCYDVPKIMQEHVLAPEKAEMIARDVFSSVILDECGLRVTVAPELEEGADDRKQLGACFDFIIRMLSNADEPKVDYYEAITHGDLNAANIIIDEHGSPWVIDFAHSGKHHILQDLVKLSSCILFEYLQLDTEEELRAAIRMVNALATSSESLTLEIPDRLRSTIMSPVELGADDEHRLSKLYFAWQACKALREYCGKYCRDATDIRQYHAGMLHYAARAITFCDTSKFSKQLAFGGMLIFACECLKIPRVDSINYTNVDLASTALVHVNDRLRREAHLNSYLNRIALKCSHQLDPVSGDVFNIHETVMLDLELHRSKDLQEYNKKVSKLEDSQSAADPALITGSTSKRRPPPLQLDDVHSCTFVNDRSSRFFEIVNQLLGVDLSRNRRVVICGPSSSGKTMVLKKIIGHALAEQEFFVPVLVNASELCKFLRQKVEIKAPYRNKEDQSSSSSSSPTTNSENGEYINFLQTEIPQSPYQIGGARLQTRPLSTIQRAVPFLASEVSGSGYAGTKRSKNRRKPYINSPYPQTPAKASLRQRDVLILHQTRLDDSHPSQNLVSAMSRKMKFPEKSSLRKSRNSKRRPSKEFSSSTHFNGAQTVQEFQIGVLELFWAFQFGESSPMFEILLSGLLNKKLLLFIDGLNDMTSETRNDLLCWLDDNPELIVILTTRQHRDIKVQLNDFALVRVKPMTQAQVAQMIRLHVKDEKRNQRNQQSLGDLEAYLYTQLRRPVFREIVSTGPVLVKMLIFALAKNWKSTKSSRSGLKEVNGAQYFTDSVQTEDWGVANILSWTIEHLLQLTARTQQTTELKQSMQQLRGDIGTSFLECVALAFVLQGVNHQQLGSLSSDAVALFQRRKWRPSKKVEPLELANALVQIHDCVPLFQVDDRDQSKPYLERTMRFSIHAVAEYLVASYYVRELTSLSPKEYTSFLLQFDRSDWEEVKINGEGGDFDSEDEESNDGNTEFARGYSETDGFSLGDDGTNSVCTYAIQSQHGSVRLLSDPRWQPILFLLLRMLYSKDVTEEVSQQLFVSFLELLEGDQEIFLSEMSKFIRFVIRNGDENALTQVLSLLSKMEAQFKDIGNAILRIFGNDKAKSRTALMITSSHGNAVLLKIILDALVQCAGKACSSTAINHLSSLGESALLLACENGQLECARLLLENGADVELCDESKSGNALYHAAFDQNLGLVLTLLEFGANPNKAVFQGTSALHNAICDGNVELCRLLLEAGADPHRKTALGISALEVANQRSNELEEILKESK